MESLIEFPEEYCDLREKLKHTQIAYNKLKEAAKYFIASGTHEEIPYSDAVKNVVQKVNRKLSISSTSANETHRDTVHNHVSTLLRDVSDNLPYGSAVADATSKAANLQLVMAGYRMEMDEQLREAITKPISAFLTTNILNAKGACEEAVTAQYDLNSIKSRCKKARPEDIAALQEQLRSVEARYSAAVEEAIVLMRLATENPESVKWLQDFNDAQIAYHKNCFELLNDKY